MSYFLSLVWEHAVFFYETQLLPVSIPESCHAIDVAQLRAALSAALIRTPALSALYSLRARHIDFIPHQ